MRRFGSDLCLGLGLYLGMVWASLAGGCVSAKIQVVDERTALENQILGSYEELDRDLQLVASVRAVDKNGKTSARPNFSQIRAQAVAARQTQRFNRDDLDELKRAGCLGEANDGKLSARKCERAAQADVAARIERLVASENQARAVLLTFVLTTSPDLTQDDRAQLARAWAKMNREQAQAGLWIQDPAGAWRQK
jgi:hypothetical protein